MRRVQRNGSAAVLAPLCSRRRRRAAMFKPRGETTGRPCSRLLPGSPRPALHVIMPPRQAPCPARPEGIGAPAALPSFPVHPQRRPYLPPPSSASSREAQPSPSRRSWSSPALPCPARGSGHNPCAFTTPALNPAGLLARRKKRLPRIANASLRGGGGGGSARR